MKKSNKKEWSRLDNAAKIFPSTTSKTDTAVFRFYCELKEKIIIEVLQKALENATKEFPNFLSVLRKGAFWYYLEASDAKPLVVLESESVCSTIYEGDNTTLLFEVSYFENRINLEIYHALSDGTGALQFLRTIVYQYLKESHGDKLPSDLVFLENDASYTQKSSDGFSKYYKKGKHKNIKKGKNAFTFKYKPSEDETIRVIEGIVSVKEVLAAAHVHGTTLTVFLTALFIDSIHKEMSLQSEKKPIVISVPVNLRNYFPSETTKNFFALIDISYDYSVMSGEFSNIIDLVNSTFKEKLTHEFLSYQINKFMAIEHNVFAKIAPLPLKNIALKCARTLDSKGTTSVISNVGKVSMPAEMHEYIDFFGVLSSTRTLQLCMCSFGDKLQIGFTSAYRATDIQKNFIRSLTNEGVTAEIRSNRFFSDEIK